MIYKRNTFLDYLESQGITLYLNSSPFLNKNRVVDRVIRTIRDKIDVRSILWLDIEHMAQLVDDYNHTPHSTLYHMFTPFQVQFTRDLERYFMKENEYKLESINVKQKELGLRDYEVENILLIYLDFLKTGSRFLKKRRNFNKLAKFISYEFGNVKCHVYNIEKHIKNSITIPIYYTKCIAESEKSIPEKYKELLGVSKINYNFFYFFYFHKNNTERKQNKNLQV
jgi:hypothetical protein